MINHITLEKSGSGCRRVLFSCPILMSFFDFITESWQLTWKFLRKTSRAESGRSGVDSIKSDLEQSPRPIRIRNRSVKVNDKGRIIDKCATWGKVGDILGQNCNLDSKWISFFKTWQDKYKYKLAGLWGFNCNKHRMFEILSLQTCSDEEYEYVRFTTFDDFYR